MPANKSNERAGCGASIGRYIIGIAVMFAIVFVVTQVSGALHGAIRTSIPKDAVDLNAVISAGQEPPIGQVARLDVSFPLGDYATSTSQTSYFGVDFNGSVDTYYAVMLDDYTVMSLKLSSKADITALNNLLDSIPSDSSALSAYIMDPNRPSYTVAGRLTELRDSEIRDFYTTALRSAGWSPSDPAVRYVVLDAVALQEDSLLRIIGPVILVAIVIFIITRIRKRTKARKAEANWYGHSE